METRPTPAGWPDGKQLAVCVNVMLEAWEDDAAPGIGPMGNPLKSGHLDSQARSWAAYGMNVGGYRLLDIVADSQVPCGCYVSGMIPGRWPDLVKRVDKDGHFAGAHAWAQNILPVYQDQNQEEADLTRSIEAFNDCIKKRPMGFISPRGTPSQVTVELLIKHGFTWHSDHFDTDLPYLIETETGSIAAVPFTMEVNDLPVYMRYGNEPEAFTSILAHILGGYAEIGSPPAVLDITAHAHVFGRPFGAIAFKRAIDLARQKDWVWMTDHAELAGTATTA